MASKRPIVSKGNTPGKPANKRVPVEGSSRKSLFSDPDSVPSKSADPRNFSPSTAYLFILGGRLDWQMAHNEKWSLLECLCKFCEQDLQFLENRFAKFAKFLSFVTNNIVFNVNEKISHHSRHIPVQLPVKWNCKLCADINIVMMRWELYFSVKPD